MQDVARLEVLPIARFLEHEILRKMLAVVAHVQPGEEDVRRAARVRVHPENAEAMQLVGR